MATKLLRYPRGYLSIQTLDDNGLDSVSEIIDVEYDPIVQSLWEEATSHNGNVDSWKFRERVIKRASQLFGDMKQWIELQAIVNDRVYDYNLNFIADTIKYITTGVREMGLNSWAALCLEYPERNPGVARLSRVSEINPYNYQLDEFITMWLKHPDGFSDMLSTLHVIFGRSKSPMKKPTLGVTR